jgi:uncharacterized secreted protein with C-terminal beta-propeller domain
MSDFETRARHAADAVRRQIAELPTQPEDGIRRAQRRPTRVAVRTAVAASILIGAVAVGVPVLRAGTTFGGGSAASGGGGPVATGDGAAYALTGPLKPFSSCESVLQYFKDQAPEDLIARVGGGIVPTTADRAASASGAGGGSDASAPEHSETNVQEAGVDEPDVVKTDGNRIVAVAQGRVHLISSVRGELTREKILPGASALNVFLSGTRLMVFSDQGAESGEARSPWFGAQAVLTMYDISSLRDPKLIATLTVDGSVLDARLVGSQVRVVTVATPDIDAPAPDYTRDGRLSKKSEKNLRAAVANTTIDDWIPSYVLRDARGTEVGEGHLVDCADLARPEKFSGLDTVAVSAFDLDSAMQDRRTVGVVAGGQQIYATGTATYVSTTEWTRDGLPATTSIHEFVTASSGASTYRGSGEVPGSLLNQYAMSEYAGVLRVASTVSERRGWVNSREVTEGMVTTLKEQDGALRRLGQIGGLGKLDNESIRAVRFIADRGYVVTFRQTDPLYVLDLRDPAAPTVLGALKIPGYSGYLHPIGPNLLLGVGQSGSGTDPGAPAGVQFSVFDISDPTSPRRVDTHTYGAGAAGAEFDPKAFLYWQPRALVVAPVDVYGDDQGRGAFSGVVLLRASANGLKELGKVRVAAGDGMASRSFVIGDAVYLLSDQALQTADLDTLRPIDELKL